MQRRIGPLARLGALVLVVASTVVAIGVGGSPLARAAGNPGGFFDGRIVYSQITNCVSIIQGSPYQESGAAAYVGAYADPDEAPPVPGVNQTFYVHVVVYGLGNACSGQYFVPALDLPTNVSLDTSQPILCFTGNGPATSASDCPQWGNVATPSPFGGDFAYYSTDTTRAQTWPLPAGGAWEFRFPVKSTTAQNGVTAQMQGYINMADGNSNPILTPTAPFWVFGTTNSPVVIHDTPSTVAGNPLPGTSIVPKWGIYSTANFTTFGAGGTARFQIGGCPSVTGAQTVSLELPSGGSSWQVSTDWDEVGVTPLVAGQTYCWRAGFTPTGGSAVNGAIQSFKVPPAATCNGLPITVAIGLGQQPTPGNDVIIGTPSAETILGLGGNDTICADGGNDTVSGGPGNDTIIGGTGTNTATYADATAGVTVSLATAQATGGAGTDTLSQISHLTGSAFADTLTGNTGNNVLSAGAGNDIVNGGDGNDTVQPGVGNDTANGGNGTDTVNYLGSSSGVTVSLASTAAQATGGSGTDTISGFENLTGSGLADTLTGSTGANAVNGGAGGDTINGGDGNDVVNPGTGNDTVNGGNGTDTLTFAGTASGVTVSLATTAAQATGGSGTDTVSAFENLTGSSFADTLTGSTGANSVNGGDGNDTLRPGGGNDTVNGGNGTDTLSYAGTTSAVSVRLDTTAAQATGGSGTETISLVENLVGTGLNDTLVGNAGANAINGGVGVDTCNGLGGVDTSTACETRLNIP